MDVKLKLLNIKSLVSHEQTNLQKVNSLAKEIHNNGFINNPVIACELIDSNYLILDGHHRVGAVKKLDGNFIPVQIVNQVDVQLDYWLHKFTSLNFLEHISNFGYQHGIKVGEYFNSKTNTKHPVFIESYNIEKLHNVINTLYSKYKDNYQATSINTNNDNYIVYNGISLQHIIDLAIEKMILPPKVTRFKVKNRILNLRTPVDSIYYGPNESWIKTYKKLSKSILYSEPILYIE